MKRARPTLNQILLTKKIWIDRVGALNTIEGYTRMDRNTFIQIPEDCIIRQYKKRRKLIPKSLKKTFNCWKCWKDLDKKRMQAFLAFH